MRKFIVTLLVVAVVLLCLAIVFMIGEGVSEKQEVRVDVAIASLGSYAGIEADRIAKMSHLMMGLGGEYTAKCEAIYDTTSEKVMTEYSITWRRVEPGPEKTNEMMVAVGPSVIEKTWTGSGWGECVGKMMIWRGGK